MLFQRSVDPVTWRWEVELLYSKEPHDSILLQSGQHEICTFETHIRLIKFQVKRPSPTQIHTWRQQKAGGTKKHCQPPSLSSDACWENFVLVHVSHSPRIFFAFAGVDLASFVAAVLRAPILGVPALVALVLGAAVFPLAD